MPKQLPPRKLTAEQLLEERHRLRLIPARLFTGADQERLHQLEAELARRIDGGDPEWCAPAAAGLEPDPATQKLDELLSRVDRVIEMAADFAPARLAQWATPELEALRRDKEAELENWKAYRTGLPGADWLEKSHSERAERVLKKICRDIRSEQRWRKTGSAPEPAAPPQASQPPQPEERLRSVPKTKLRSTFRRQVLSYLIEHREASTQDVCGWCDQEGHRGPGSWYAGAGRARELQQIYRNNPAIRGRIDKCVSDVRRYRDKHQL